MSGWKSSIERVKGANGSKESVRAHGCTPANHTFSCYAGVCKFPMIRTGLSVYRPVQSIHALSAEFNLYLDGRKTNSSLNGESRVPSRLFYFFPFVPLCLCSFLFRLGQSLALPTIHHTLRRREFRFAAHHQVPNRSSIVQAARFQHHPESAHSDPVDRLIPRLLREAQWSDVR